MLQICFGTVISMLSGLHNLEVVYLTVYYTQETNPLSWEKLEYLSNTNDVLSVQYIIANILNRKQTNAKQQQQAILILTCSLCRL